MEATNLVPLLVFFHELLTQMSSTFHTILTSYAFQCKTCYEFQSRVKNGKNNDVLF